MDDIPDEDIPLKKPAFTMLELVFVIVVVGILAAALIPRINRDALYEASEQLQSHIKYTQHLALMESVYDDGNTNWYRGRWRITFDDTNDRYAISRGSGRYAKDPLSQAPINGMGGGNDYDMMHKYHVTFSLPGASNILAFDHLGRPYLFSGDQTAPTSDRLENPFNISISTGSDSATITVNPETGSSTITFN